MKKHSIRLHFSLVAAFVALLGLFSCDENTALIGQSVMPEKDFVKTSQDTFVVKTQSLRVDSVLANTSNSLLGVMIEPTHRVMTTAGFVSQFNLPENYHFPKADSLVWGSDGLPLVDSVDMYLYVDNYYGDSLRTMKLVVQELDTAKVMREGVKYYTNLQPEKFVTEGVGVRATATYSVRDNALTNNKTNGYHFLRVKLPVELGKRIVAKYYQSPQYYQNAQQFIRHIFAGLYVSVDGTVGSMLSVPFATLNILFHYKDKGVVNKVYAQFATTEEVLQNSAVVNKIPASMLDATNDYTYLYSPAAIFTEGTIPVKEVFVGHEKDSINNARLIIRTYDEVQKGELQAPKNVLLIAKNEVHTFFEENRLPDNRTSFLGVWNKGGYSFHNIANLITQMRHLRDKGAGVATGDSESEKMRKTLLWEAQNPDWNKFVLIPVSAQYTADPKDKDKLTLRRLRHDMKLQSVKLEGGMNKGIELHIMYTSFQN